jgi:hypothetical protein
MKTCEYGKDVSQSAQTDTRTPADCPPFPCQRNHRERRELAGRRWGKLLLETTALVSFDFHSD